MRGGKGLLRVFKIGGLGNQTGNPETACCRHLVALKSHYITILTAFTVDLQDANN